MAGGLSFELIDSEEEKFVPTIKVIGVGGAGGNAVKNMIHHGLEGVEFIVVNTDLAVLELNPAPTKIQIGKKLTKGKGAGGDPEIGRRAAEESEKEIRDYLKDADMVFIAAGMGGGTGTGASPVIAEICKSLDILTVAVVTRPFSFEGMHRLKVAEKGIEELSKYVDTLITIPNDRVISLGSPQENFQNMLKKADDVLYYAVKGISELILKPGYINLDFADVKAVMQGTGAFALMGVGESSGEKRAEEATYLAISSPLLDDVSISGAQGVILNISVNPQTFSIGELQTITGIVSKEVDPQAKFYWGLVYDESLGDLLRVTVIATGLRSPEEENEVPEEQEEKVVNIAEGLKKREVKEREIDFEEDLVLDEETLDIPTFLRRNAD